MLEINKNLINVYVEKIKYLDKYIEELEGGQYIACFEDAIINLQELSKAYQELSEAFNYLECYGAKFEEVIDEL